MSSAFPNNFGGSGMDLRDYFAAKIAAVFLRDAVLPTPEVQAKAFEAVSALAYGMAEAMIVERNKR